MDSIQYGLDYESDETDPEINFIGPMDSNDMVGFGRHEDVNAESDTESAVGNISVTEVQGDTPDDEKIIFGGIWWNSSWA